MAEAIHRMDELVQDLLAYSRVSRAELTLEPIDLAGMVADIIRQLSHDLEERKAEVLIEGSLPTVQAHGVTLSQVLTNLISNAVKFVAKGVRPRIVVRAELRDGSVRIWVEDNGIGIAPENQARIFGVFVRLHSTDDFPGTGIGLAIVEKGVQRMGGRVGLESQVGKGSRFWIELPNANRE